MNGVAAKIAQKIGMFFQHEDRNAGASEKEAEHHSGRAAADDDAAGLQFLIHANCATSSSAAAINIQIEEWPNQTSVPRWFDSLGAIMVRVLSRISARHYKIVMLDARE